MPEINEQFNLENMERLQKLKCVEVLCFKEFVFWKDLKCVR